MTASHYALGIVVLRHDVAKGAHHHPDLLDTWAWSRRQVLDVNQDQVAGFLIDTL
jgi:hypothetical protein